MGVAFAFQREPTTIRKLSQNLLNLVLLKDELFLFRQHNYQPPISVINAFNLNDHLMNLE